MRAPRSVTLRADRHPLAELEARDRLARLAHLGALAGDDRQLLDRGVERLRVGLRVADAHVQRDLLDLRHLHDRAQAELLLELRAQLGVAVLQARAVGRGRHYLSTSWPQPSRLQTRTRTVSPLTLLDLDPDARRQLADGADEHHVRDVDGRGLLDPAARGHLRAAHAVGVAQRARARVPRHHVQVLDEHAAVARARLDDPALLAAVLAGEDLDEIALLDLHLRCHVSQSTSGARLTIFMKFFSRNSRATGPKMRVPRGLRAASMITAAFSSNAICVPSSRP